MMGDLFSVTMWKPPIHLRGIPSEVWHRSTSPVPGHRRNGPRQPRNVSPIHGDRPCRACKKPRAGNERVPFQFHPRFGSLRVQEADHRRTPHNRLSLGEQDRRWLMGPRLLHPRTQTSRIRSRPNHTGSLRLQNQISGPDLQRTEEKISEASWNASQVQRDWPRPPQPLTGRYSYYFMKNKVEVELARVSH